MVLATKVHHRMADDDPNAFGNSRRHLVEQCDASLRRLGTDWIYLYQVHRPQPEGPIDKTLRALDDLVRSGNLRQLPRPPWCSEPARSRSPPPPPR